MTTSTRRADVIVIGAGMAGITAAQSLRQLAPEVRIVVLEGRDRIGGRIWTYREWPEAPIELGASWVTHLTVNPLGLIAKENDIQLVDSDLMNVTLTRANGDHLSDEEMNETMLRYFELYGTVKLGAEERREKGKPDTDLGHVLSRALKRMKLSRQKQLDVEYFANMSIAEANAANFDQLSLYEWEDDYIEVMLRAAVVPEGYVRFADALAEGLDIRFEHTVRRISQDDKGVTVTTNRGDFEAAYAVITVPHAVLAGKSIDFSPRLPGWKRKAIAEIGIGLSDKF